MRDAMMFVNMEEQRVCMAKPATCRDTSSHIQQPPRLPDPSLPLVVQNPSSLAAKSKQRSFANALNLGWEAALTEA
ncbi:hypothetical protein FRC03_008303 [Tulasnella sp. 419]|nr:hypothetical protein FRC03_008303 [Tulasnella sp. 419]